MTARLFALTALLGLASAAVAADSGHHRHEGGSLPAPEELCSCGQSSFIKSQGGRCTIWHCHPGEAEAHKAPWKPGKAVALKTGKKDALQTASESCAAKAPTDGPGVSELHSCQAWEAKADCSGKEPALLTRCTETLDPAFRFSRKDEKGSECLCAEWKSVADTSSCTAYMCRPKRKG